MGKGSKRRVENFREILNRWDEINWKDNKSDIYCFNCGVLLDKENLKNHPELYIIHGDFEIEHKNCNFN